MSVLFCAFLRNPEMRCKNPKCTNTLERKPSNHIGRKQQFCSHRCGVMARRIRQTARAAEIAEMIRNEWHSPAEVVEAARSTMGGIDLDPASCELANAIIKATTFYSVGEDGLARDWFGKVWLNPPYSTKAPKFVNRFAEAFTAGTVEQGILLLGTHHLTTDWFAALAPLRPIACLPPKRLQFSGSTARPAHGSVLIGIGVDHDRFTIAFRPIGRIWLLLSQ